MKKWNYEVKGLSIQLRELINESNSDYSDCIKILEKTVEICEYIKTILSEKDKDIWEDSFDDMIDSIQDAIDYEISEDNDTEENEDIVNHYLSELYDLCDTANIFLAV